MGNRASHEHARIINSKYANIMIELHEINWKLLELRLDLESLARKIADHHGLSKPTLKRSATYMDMRHFHRDTHNSQKTVESGQYHEYENININNSSLEPLNRPNVKPYCQKTVASGQYGKDDSSLESLNEPLKNVLLLQAKRALARNDFLVQIFQRQAVIFVLS